MVFTFVLTAFFNTEMGLEFGILASIVVLVWQISSLDVYAVRSALLHTVGSLMSLPPTLTPTPSVPAAYRSGSCGTAPTAPWSSLTCPSTLTRS